MLKRVVAFVFVAAALVGALVFSQYHREPMHVSGFIESHEIRIGSRVGGRVSRVLVEEGQSVKAAELLVELEPFQLNELRAQAAANLAQVTATRDKIKAGFEPKKSRRQKLTMISSPRPSKNW